MRALVFGQSGQVAQELARFEGVQCLSRADVDLRDPKACAIAIYEASADVVINAAAYTGVDAAETDPDVANAVNRDAPAAMARACASIDLPLLQVSTDYVFDGAGTAPFREEDPTGPLGVYGASKLAGETRVRDAGGAHAILRTSWVVSAHGANFVKTMLRLGAERGSLNVVADQIGGPTPARDIAAALMQMAEQIIADPGKSGTYHFAGAPDVSWAGFAREIFVQSGIACDVADIPASGYPTPAERPLNSRLDCSKVATVFDINRPDWRLGLTQILRDLGQIKA